VRHYWFENGRSESIGRRLDPELLDPLHRLVELLDDLQLLPYLALLIQQEIVFRLLMSRHGPHLRKLVTAEWNRLPTSWRG
jgi:hypothetical protein